MSVVLKPVEARFEPTGLHHLDLLMGVEQRAYAHPWTRANFTDSLSAGYPSQVLMGGDEVLGYFFAMKGVDEVHLLNITVAPEFQRQGWSRVMLDALVIWSRAQGAQWLWLEVRVGNTRALAVYEKYGFRRMGQRKNYYPAAHGQREDALVMSLRL